jgi:hypothetical protein
MNGIPFLQTPMGNVFFTKTAPQAARELGRLADGIERLNALLEQLLAAQQREPVEKAGRRGGKPMSSILDDIPEVLRDKVQRRRQRLGKDHQSGQGYRCQGEAREGGGRRRRHEGFSWRSLSIRADEGTSRGLRCSAARASRIAHYPSANEASTRATSAAGGRASGDPPRPRRLVTGDGRQ